MRGEIYIYDINSFFHDSQNNILFIIFFLLGYGVFFSISKETYKRD